MNTNMTKRGMARVSEQNDNRDECAVVVDRPAAKERLKLEPPPNYAVVMLDDDFTPMDFVVLVLTRLFNKTLEEAETIMMDVHEKGKAWAGCYTRDIAEARVAQVHETAQANGHPFQCVMEPIL